jgi:hypothetical protein
LDLLSCLGQLEKPEKYFYKSTWKHWRTKIVIKNYKTISRKRQKSRDLDCFDPADLGLSRRDLGEIQLYFFFLYLFFMNIW